MISPWIAGLLATAILAGAPAACLVPSFDGFQGSGSDGGGDADAGPGSNDAAAIKDARRDIDPDAPTFACDTNGLRCLRELEFCCGQLLADSICKTPPIGLIDCSEVLTCGDGTDCTGGDVCCFDRTTSKGACGADCTGTTKLVVCDNRKTPTSCPAPQKCTGVLSDTVAFCQ